jgi:hypothetical protein
MSEQLFEVAFSGKLMEGANPDEVRAKVGKMFNADAAKVAQLFSGKRIVIKKNIDQATAAKYRTALNRAGAECEVRQMGAAAAEKPAATKSAPAPASEKPTAPASAASAAEPVDYGDVAPPPQTDPLGITGDQIDDLAVSLAPVGSDMQDKYETPDEPEFDLTGFDLAPVGADLDTTRKEAPPPPPDTTGLSLEE